MSNQIEYTLSALAALDPLRDGDILVSHGPESRWHSWKECGHSDPVYLRQVLTNEVLFEADLDDWILQRDQIRKFTGWLDAHGVSYLLAWSGGKSFHLSVFFDPTSPFDANVMRGINTDRIDILKVARMTLWRELPRSAGVMLPFDPSNNRFGLAKQGRMVRFYGSKKPDAKPHVTPYTWLMEVPEERPTSQDFEYPPEFPPEFRLFDASDYMTAVSSALLREDERIKNLVPVDEAILEAIGKDWQMLIAARSWFRPGTFWPAGSRYMRAATCIRAMITVCLTTEEIYAELERLEAHVREEDYDFNAMWYATADRFVREGNSLKDTEIDAQTMEEIEARRRFRKAREYAKDHGVIL